MGNLKVISLYSGSTGNATLVSGPGGDILIDAGKSARTLSLALCREGYDIKKIKAVFITHEHSDHVSALTILLKKHNIPVHMTEPTADAVEAVCGRLRGIVRHPPVFSERVGDMNVRSFVLSHDSSMCVGYRIDTDGGETLGIATDTGYVTEGMEKELCGCEAVIIESNYDEEMLKFGSYPIELKRRIGSRSGHLSNSDCAKFASRLAVRGTKRFMLAHISRENNTPETALLTVKKALAQFPGIRVSVARPDDATPFPSAEL